MKNSIKKMSYGCLLLLMLLNTWSCRKDGAGKADAVKGCTNKNATNYNSNAQQDDGSCCIPQETKYQRSGDVYELGYPVPFASFSFEQTATSFKLGCSPDKYSTTLKIRNLTGMNLSFGYTVLFRLNAISWSSTNNVTLSPGQTLDLGEINQNPGRIDLGIISIPCYNVRVY
jgi:hypothetical protein